MIDHFPSVKGNKGDPQLVWSFGDSEVEIKSLETSIDTKGKVKGNNGGNALNGFQVKRSLRQSS
jgi:hypothetical protein